ncbi:MAG: DUF4105 domain-containing protein [Dysgonamonadaceae bacterium]|jgi:hypothetical protein|nr:DUF4105 domain-containing protein [Dysgonamonadaceae bacterium]
MKKILFFLVFISINSIFSFAYAISGDHTQISLLTVMPRPNGVYTIYGHTAIRVQNTSEKIDEVFNYGTFDFDSPNFMYRFVKGETDYYISADAFRFFKYHYASTHATVIEQVLNIPSKEREEIFNFLIINMKPQNREYRYNYFFDNCTTRPRDIIEKYCGGKLVYTEDEKSITLRDLVHECTAPYPWMTFGIDLVIGNGADSTINKRSELFLPVKLMETLNEAYVADDNLQQRPVVLSSKTIIGPESLPPSKSWSDPMKLGIILVIHCLVFAVAGYFLKRKFRFFYALMFLNVAIGGCIVAFVALISSHPCTWPNWNLLWIHPLHFIPVAGYFFKKTYRLIRWYHWSNFVLLSGILSGWHFIPQELNVACIPFIICLWISSGYKLLIDKKLDK